VERAAQPTAAIRKPAAATKTGGAKKKAAATQPSAAAPQAKKKAAATQPSAAAPQAKKKAAAAQPAAAAPKRSAAAMKVGRRADLGAPVDGFFAKQPPHLRALLDQLRALIEEAAPEATSSIKWGMPFYLAGGQTVCALAAFKAHVNLILPGPPGTFADPAGLLEGDGKTGRHLKLRALAELPRAAVRGWLQIAAARARSSSRA
jgi:hypothetical protein